MPGTNIIGMNAATVVRTAKVTGLAISLAPSMAPRSPSPCSSWWRWMFSTMIASSTTIPSTRVKANSEMTLADTSSDGIIAMAPRNEIGMPRLTQKASRSSRNSVSTMKTSTNPLAPVRSIRLRRSFSTSASFSQIVIETPSGSRARVRST